MEFTSAPSLINIKTDEDRQILFSNKWNYVLHPESLINPFPYFIIKKNPGYNHLKAVKHSDNVKNLVALNDHVKSMLIFSIANLLVFTLNLKFVCLLLISLPLFLTAHGMQQFVSFHKFYLT